MIFLSHKQLNKVIKLFINVRDVQLLGPSDQERILKKPVSIYPLTEV